MNKIVFILALLLSSLTVGCGSQSLRTETPVSLQDDALARMPEVCSGASIRQRLGSQGVTVDGVTYFCGSF